MKQDTLEGRAKTKNGVKRLCFSIVCILLEVIFIIVMVTRLNEYAEVVNLFTRLFRGMYFTGSSFYHCYDHIAESICGDYQSDDKASCRCTGS